MIPFPGKVSLEKLIDNYSDEYIHNHGARQPQILIQVGNWHTERLGETKIFFQKIRNFRGLPTMSLHLSLIKSEKKVQEKNYALKIKEPEKNWTELRIKLTLILGFAGTSLPVKLLMSMTKLSGLSPAYWNPLTWSEAEIFGVPISRISSDPKTWAEFSTNHRMMNRRNFDGTVISKRVG